MTLQHLGLQSNVASQHTVNVVHHLGVTLLPVPCLSENEMYAG